MTALTIRDVPEDDVRILKVRAAEAGKSLQAYLRSLISREVSKPTLASAIGEIRRNATADITTQDVLDAIDEGRRGR